GNLICTYALLDSIHIVPGNLICTYALLDRLLCRVMRAWKMAPWLATKVVSRELYTNNKDRPRESCTWSRG
uniref:Uncharacterized protein n=1 Tax=Triticum urartu TaxID=4572 RepID=A0A8R7QV16_TRIUA